MCIMLKLIISFYTWDNHILLLILNGSMLNLPLDLSDIKNKNNINTKLILKVISYVEKNYTIFIILLKKKIFIF